MDDAYEQARRSWEVQREHLLVIQNQLQGQLSTALQSNTMLTVTIDSMVKAMGVLQNLLEQRYGK